MPGRAQKRGENWGNEGKTGRDRIPPSFSAMMMWRESVRRVLVEELTLWENVTVFCNKPVKLPVGSELPGCPSGGGSICSKNVALPLALPDLYFCWFNDL